MNSRLNQQHGGASLLTTVILAVLLLGVVGGLTSLSIHELRQASNTEQSARALSAAESGVTLLSDKIANESAPHERTACNADPSSPTVAKPPYDIGGGTTVTCATVNSKDSDVTIGAVDRDQSYKIDVSHAYKKAANGVVTVLPVTAMSIEWASSDDYKSNGSLSLNAFYPSLQVPGNWAGPAALELSYIWWTTAADGSITPLNDPTTHDFGLSIKKVVVQPGFNVSGLSPTTICHLSGAYACQTGTAADAKFSLLSGGNGLGVSAPNLIFKLTGRYNGTHFRLKFFNGADQLFLAQPDAIIDVTARSNNLYRRVIAQKQLSVEGSSIDYLDNTLFSGKNICKDLSVDASNAPTYSSGLNNNACENPPTP